ncbi:MAG: peptidoglycan-binding domain-containing protein [Jatrophihabitantaceae bacterium]
MNEYAPSAIRGLYDLVKARIPAAELSGIVGDSAHTYGYHRCRNVVPGGDYSRQHALDQQGDGWAASALDVTLPPDQMRAVTARLISAAKVGDPRLRALREFCGTTDGTRTHSFDLSNRREALGEWDASHLWHVHLSIYRAHTNDPAALAPIADVMGGGASPQPGPPSKPSAADPAGWPLPTGHYFGLITGPDECHGGINAAEGNWVRKIQQRLQALGYAPKAAGWADGKFEAPTKDAVAAWQRAKYAHCTSRYGEIWSDDWARLFA